MVKYLKKINYKKGKIMENLNGYICLYRGKRFEVYANTAYEAKVKCAKENKIKKQSEISVFLAEKNGETIVNDPIF